MGRPRKEPLGINGETLTAELIKNGHGAKIGSRLYLRYPQPETDTKALRRDSFFGKNRPVDFDTFEVFRNLDEAMREAMDVYLKFHEVKDLVSQYLSTDGETVHDKYHTWKVPPQLASKYYELIEEMRRKDFYQEANRCAQKFFDITDTDYKATVKDLPSDIWETLQSARTEDTE